MYMHCSMQHNVARCYVKPHMFLIMVRSMTFLIWLQSGHAGAEPLDMTASALPSAKPCGYSAYRMQVIALPGLSVRFGGST